MPDYWITIEHSNGKTLMSDGRVIDHYKIAADDNAEATDAARKIVQTVANEAPDYVARYRGERIEIDSPFTLTVTTKDPNAK